MTELISIIVPMYNEEEMVDLFFDTIIPILKSIKNYDYEIVAVNDGSKDKTLELLKEKQKTVEELVIVDFTRNFGHEAAVSAGLKNASGDVLIPLDADLQDPPSLIPELIKKYEEGYEVVDAKRGSRKDDTFMKRTTAKMFYSLINKISDIDVPNNVGHYRLITRKVADAVNAL